VTGTGPEGRGQATASSPPSRAINQRHDRNTTRQRKRSSVSASSASARVSTKAVSQFQRAARRPNLANMRSRTISMLS